VSKSNQPKKLKQKSQLSPPRGIVTTIQEGRQKKENPMLTSSPRRAIFVREVFLPLTGGGRETESRCSVE
jgi:hypothetical protein